MKNTTFYSLKQPEDNDNVLIDDLNGNFDVIDQTLHELDEEKAAKAKPKSAGNLAELTADGALQDSGRAPGKPNGVATLDGNGKIPVSQVPNKYLPLAGGTMSGPINMGNQRITNLPKPAADTEPLRRLDGLSSITAALFGLGADSVPDDALALLSRFNSGLGNDYIWRRSKVTKGYFEKRGELTVQDNITLSSSWRYCEEISISQSDGTITPISPQPLPSSSSDKASTLTHKYIYNTGSGDITQLRYVSYMESRPAGAVYYTYYPVSSEYKYEETDVSYVNSPSPDAYPPSVSDGYTYTSLGQIGKRVQIATGSYVGTGTYGSSNPNSLTFDAPPKLVFIYSRKSSNSSYYAMQLIFIPELGDVSGYGFMDSGSSGDFNYIDDVYWSNNGRTVNWYDQSDATTQANASGYTYHYIVLM